MIPAAKFWAKADRRAAKECWPWLGDVGDCGFGYRKGYGRLQWTERGKSHRWHAHRIAYALTFGPFPKHLYICHDCDNPRCVNPKHLFVGTQLDNMRDAREKGRTNIKPAQDAAAKMRAEIRAKRTRCKNGHPWKKNVALNAAGYYFCRKCSNDSARRYYANHPERAKAAQRRYYARQTAR